MSSFPFAPDPDPSESVILDICQAEQQRQWRTLIMIASESICHPAAASVLATEMGNLYAEGQPPPILCHNPRQSSADSDRFQSWQTRLADRRFYKGTINANRVELAAQRCIAEVFAALDGSPKAEDIRVNVQALSGAPANIATYEALLSPGDRILGLDLAHGGHLTHGSEFNFSGKTYEAHSYGVDEKTRRLDYAQIREQARQVRPTLMIGGASSYPWDFDWAALREIADEVGAYLLADTAHLAGLIAAGVLNNPVPHAHIVTFTTHKTLCGPRGAVILTADPELAAKVDAGVFPNLQGGPHMNSIAAIGRLFEMICADPQSFRSYQERVVRNANFFAECLTEQGFELEYGGTNTHMVLVDLKPFPVEGDTFLDGEIASRLLEISGLVCNKNMLPGDCDGAHASGLRFGLPWLTQRGISDEQLREIASIVKSVLEKVKTCTIWSPAGDRKCRGRVPAGTLEEASCRTLALAEALPFPERPAPLKVRKEPTAIGDRIALLMRGDKVKLALSQMLTARMPHDGAPVRANMLDADGSLIDDLIVAELDMSDFEEQWLVLPHADKADAVRQWIENLSDGYLLFDSEDLQQKVDGPSVLEDVDADSLPAEVVSRVKAFGGEPQIDPSKPYFIGQRALYAKAPLPPKEAYTYEPEEIPLRKTALNDVHRKLGAKMAPFAGWDMPIQYPTGILAEHRAVRSAAGLFDVSHMGALEISGPHALPFMEALSANCVSRLAPGEAEYSYLLYPDGTAIDDVYIYRLDPDRFMMVVNAANAERVKDWILSVNSRSVIIDRQMPGKQVDGPVAFRDLRDAGEDSLVGLAFQGPASVSVLAKLAGNPVDRASLCSMLPNTILHLSLAGFDVMAARTGYTGEKHGFELYVHPSHAVELWNAILEVGRPMGVLPTGLGARDSTRLEAGFPLFGHELEGDCALSLTEAGYGFVVRYHVPFFIGRSPYMARVEKAGRHVIRVKGNGRKTVRPGHVILDTSGQVIGQVTSFAYVHEDMTYVALACVSESFQPEPGQVVRGARIAASKAPDGIRDNAIVELTALTRFPDEEETQIWPERYAAQQ